MVDVVIKFMFYNENYLLLFGFVGRIYFTLFLPVIAQHLNINHA